MSAIAALGALKPLLAFLAALCGGLAVALAATNVRLMPASSKALADYLSSQAPPTFVEKVGEVLAKRVHVGGTEEYRRWIALVERPPSQAHTLGMSAILGGAFIVLTFVTGAPVLLILAIIGFVYPFVRLRSRANAVKRKVQRSLPEMAALMAAEMSAGNPPDKAVERAAEWGGPLSRIVKEAVEAARSTGRPLFGRGNIPGILVEVVREKYPLPALLAFVSQIDLAARKGAAGPELMESLARTLIIEYKDRALREAEQLDNRLAMPAVLFFFLPFLFIILVPMLVPLIKMM